MLDCGLSQGRREESERLNREYPADPASVDAVVLSHAHIDHQGKLPGLVGNGFRGPVYSTAATRDLASIMLPDSAHIQRADADYLNRRRRAQGKPPVEPLYGLQEVTATLERFVSVPYRMPINLFPGISVRMLDAGHILGSAQIELTVNEGDDPKVLLYTGDLGRPDRPILKDPDLSSRPHILMMESTYGGREHEPGEECLQKLAGILRKAFARGGKVIVPAFSVGRTQEVLYFLRQLDEAGEMPDMRVYVDSPLSFDATGVYRRHPECFDEDAMALLEAGAGPFSFEKLKFIQGVEESKALNHMKDSMVIISASGMCENGRIRHHLKNTIENPSNIVLITGFMAADTLGRKIAERMETVNIFGDPYRLRAEVEEIPGMSAHADSGQLLDFFRRTSRQTDTVILVHGEKSQTGALAKSVGGEAGSRVRVLTPESGDFLEH